MNVGAPEGAILVVCPASLKLNWRREIRMVDPDAVVEIIGAKDGAPDGTPRWVIVNYDLLTRNAARLHDIPWAGVILDEAHFIKNASQRTSHCLKLLGVQKEARAPIIGPQYVFLLTGTPMPNSPFDLYPFLRFAALGKLLADPAKGWPSVTVQATFKARYCVTKPMRIGSGYAARWIDVIVGGKNLQELRQRTEGLILRRTQQDVGIRAPIYETMPLIVSATQRRLIAGAAQAERDILAAIDTGSTKDLEMHLGPLRRLTGGMKADGVIEAVKEEFEGGLDKVVLAYWHKDVGQRLIDGLSQFGVVGIDGATPANKRDENVRAFQKGSARVFLAQIQAAGEAIDLSAAAELIFVEMSFIPKDGKQMALRITNHSQTRQARVRVATLEGSIDEAIQTSLLRKWSSINEVLAP
jgi:SNF2 family DNA or RNA helicase